MDELDPLDPELRLFYCVCSTVPHKVLLRAERLRAAEPADLHSVLALMQDALTTIVQDLDAGDVEYRYGHNDVERFRARSKEVGFEVATLAAEVRAASRHEDYLQMARLIGAERLAVAIVEFEELIAEG